MPQPFFPPAAALAHRPSAQPIGTIKWTVTALAITAASVGCFDGERRAFEESRTAIQVGMTLGEAFEAGLADYLQRSGTKNVPGATVSGHRPSGDSCPRYVLDVLYSGGFSVRVYCERNDPHAQQLIPARSFASRRQLAIALDTTHKPFTANMEFRIESPPRGWFGIYDHYLMRTGPEGAVAFVSAVVPSPVPR